MRRALARAWLLLAAGCGFNPGAAQHSLVQGDMLLVKKDYRGAIGLYDQAVAADPYLKQAYLHRGVAYREHGNFERAAADLSRAIELDPAYARAYTERARTMIAWATSKADGDRERLAKA